MRCSENFFYLRYPLFSSSRRFLMTAIYPRVASVLPSATESLCAIGGERFLVARSHEDNYPFSITDRPIITGQITSKAWTNASEIDRQVSDALSSGKSLYTIDSEQLISLRPDIILTQDICSVCAIDLDTVNRIANSMDPKPQVITLNPQSIDDVLEDLIIIGKAVGLENEAHVIKENLHQRVQHVIKVASSCTSSISSSSSSSSYSSLSVDTMSVTKKDVKVAFIEWSDPIYIGGHWTPQLIKLAGGIHSLNPAGEGMEVIYVQTGGAGKSFPVPHTAVIAADPDVVIVAPCGLNLNEARREADMLLSKDWFASLRAVRNGRLYVVDGDAMFNRPGPRLVQALEWLVSVLHPHHPDALALCPSSFPSQQIIPKKTFESGSESGSESEGNLSTMTMAKSSLLNTKTSQIENSGNDNDNDNDNALPTVPSHDSTTATATDINQTSQRAQSQSQSPSLPIDIDIEDIHRAACTAGLSHYNDPTTGYLVFTEVAHLTRGKCCGNKCRHCPFGHFNVNPTKRSASIDKPTLLRCGTIGRNITTTPASGSGSASNSNSKPIFNGIRRLEVLFWSGGKDSYLAYLYLQKTKTMPEDTKIVMLTTFDMTTGLLDHQGLHFHDIMNQTKALGVDVMLCPLPSQCSNIDYINAVNVAVKLLESTYLNNNMNNDVSSGSGSGGSSSSSSKNSIESPSPAASTATAIRLIFGDLRLEDIKLWRQSSFPHRECFFPLFLEDYDTLLNTLFTDKNIQIRISAVDNSLFSSKSSSNNINNCSNNSHKGRFPSVGDIFNTELVDSLPVGCDKMGENGEFHTRVIFAK